ncbi:MFS transporter [Chloroflexota bacterium]
MSYSIPQKDAGQGTIQAGHYLWIVLPLVLGAMLVQALIGMGIPVLYPFIQVEFGLSHAQVGLITSTYAIGGLTTVLLAGWLTDYLGAKRMISISLVSMTVFIAAFPLAHSWHIVLALVVILSVSGSPMYPATTRAVMDWVPGRIRGLAMSLKQTGPPIAGALAAAILPILALAVGWRMAAASMGILILFTAIAFLSLYRDAPRGKEAMHRLNISTLRVILQNRRAVTIAIWGGTFVGLQFTVLSYFILFLMEELQLSPIMAGGMLSIAQVSSIIARILWGSVSDFIFHRRRIAVLVIAGFMTVIGLLGASIMTADVPGSAVFLLAITIGTSTFSFHGVLTALIGETADTGQVGTTTGFSNTLMRTGTLVVPPIFGYLVDVSSSYSLSWRVAAGAALVSTLALLAFGREPRREHLSGISHR